jgi:hypothetical protein
LIVRPDAVVEANQKTLQNLLAYLEQRTGIAPAPRDYGFLLLREY